MDKRRRPYAAIDTFFAYSNTSQRLQQQYGHAGVLAWLLLILAAKRAPIQGQITFAGEAHFWRELGIVDPPDFDWLDFLGFLGKLKQTRKTWQNTTKTLINVQITHFEDWQKMPEAELARRRMSRKRAENTRNDTRTMPERNPNDNSTERRGEERTKVLSPKDQRSRAENAGGYAESYAAAAAWIHAQGRTLAPTAVAEHIVVAWPELEDETVQQLVDLAAQPAPEAAA